MLAEFRALGQGVVPEGCVRDDCGLGQRDSCTMSRADKVVRDCRTVRPDVPPPWELVCVAGRAAVPVSGSLAGTLRELLRARRFGPRGASRLLAGPVTR